MQFVGERLADARRRTDDDRRTRLNAVHVDSRYRPQECLDSGAPMRRQFLEISRKVITCAERVESSR